jgi:hypothetical protein
MMQTRMHSLKKEGNSMEEEQETKTQLSQP